MSDVQNANKFLLINDFKIIKFSPFRFLQKNKQKSSYDGIRYNKLETPETGKNVNQSSADEKNTKTLIAGGGINLSQGQLLQAYEEDGDDDDNEETRFIKSNRSSFYTSSERT